MNALEANFKSRNGNKSSQEIWNSISENIREEITKAVENKETAVRMEIFNGYDITKLEQLGYFVDPHCDDIYVIKWSSVKL